MKVDSNENTIVIASTNSHNNAVVGFVSELLAMTLAGQNEDITVEAQSEDFFYDEGAGMQTTLSLKAVIDCEDIETDDKLEITLSGIVENLQGQKESFTLFFFTWLDRELNHTQKEQQHITNISKKHLSIQFENPSELFDSVFELKLYLKDRAGQQCSLGQGRGYFVFDNEHKTGMN